MNNNLNNESVNPVTENNPTSLVIETLLPKKNNTRKILFIILIFILLIVVVNLTFSLINKTNEYKLTQVINKNVSENTPSASIKKTNDKVFVKGYGHYIYVYNFLNQEKNQLSLGGYDLIHYGSTYSESDKYIFLSKDSRIYYYNTDTNEIVQTSLPLLEKYQTQGEEGIASVDTLIFSKDETKVIIVINQNQFGMGGEPPLKTNEYIYDISKDKYEKSNVLNNVKKITKNTSLHFYQWDSDKNIMYVGNLYDYGNNPEFNKYLYLVDLNKKALVKAIKLNSDHGETYLSPNLDKYITIDDVNVSLYSIDDATVPLKVFKKTWSDTHFYNLVWSFDENQIAIAFKNGIYVIDINSEIINLKFSDTNNRDSYRTIGFTPSGQYLIFTDEVNNYSNVSELPFKTVAIDLESGNQVTLFNFSVDSSIFILK